MKPLVITTERMREKYAENRDTYLYFLYFLFDFVRIENVATVEGLSDFKQRFADFKDIPQYICFPLKTWISRFPRRESLMAFRVHPEKYVCHVWTHYQQKGEESLIELATIVGCEDKARNAFVRENRPEVGEVSSWENAAEFPVFLDDFETSMYFKCGVRGNCFYILWEAKRSEEAKVAANRILCDRHGWSDDSESNRLKNQSPWRRLRSLFGRKQVVLRDQCSI